MRIGWRRDGAMLEIWVKDEGPGLSGTANLFVPFFTTKPGGSGIGLVLSRQIAEGHGGALTLENRDRRAGLRRAPAAAGMSGAAAKRVPTARTKFSEILVSASTGTPFRSVGL